MRLVLVECHRKNLRSHAILLSRPAYSNPDLTVLHRCSWLGIGSLISYSYFMATNYHQLATYHSASPMALLITITSSACTSNPLLFLPEAPPSSFPTVPRIAPQAASPYSTARKLSPCSSTLYMTRSILR